MGGCEYLGSEVTGLTGRLKEPREEDVLADLCSFGLHT